MAQVEQPARVYTLSEGVRIFRNGEEIRLRKGIWNYSEAALQLTGQDDTVVRFFEIAYSAFAQDEGIDPSAVAARVGMSAEDLASCSEWFESLLHQQFLRSADLRDAVRVSSALLGGGPTGFEERVGNPRPVLLFADTEYIGSTAENLASEIALPLDFLNAQTIRELAAADLTTRTDAVAYRTIFGKVQETDSPLCLCRRVHSLPQPAVAAELEPGPYRGGETADTWFDRRPFYDRSFRSAIGKWLFRMFRTSYACPLGRYGHLRQIRAEHRDWFEGRQTVACAATCHAAGNGHF